MVPIYNCGVTTSKLSRSRQKGSTEANMLLTLGDNMQPTIIKKELPPELKQDAELPEVIKGVNALQETLTAVHQAILDKDLGLQPRVLKDL